MDDEDYDNEIKQALLQEEIVDKNYEKFKFVDFCLSKKEDGDDLNNWTLSELKDLIKEFQCKNQSNKSIQNSDKDKYINDKNENENLDINENKKLREELNRYKRENKKLNDELNNYKRDNKKLEEELNDYKLNQEKLIEELLNSNESDNNNFKDEIQLLKEENIKLNNELAKVNKIIANINNMNQNEKENNNFNEINYLKEIIKSKEKEIDFLNIQLKNIQSGNKLLVDFENIIVINFVSSDNKINCGIKCLKTNTFAEVEEKLYQRYEEYRDSNNNYITKGKLVLRFKKICDNGINDGDVVQLIKIE